MRLNCKYKNGFDGSISPTDEKKAKIFPTLEHFSFSLETSEVIIDSGVHPFLSTLLEFFVIMDDIFFGRKLENNGHFFISVKCAFGILYGLSPHLAGLMSIINTKPTSLTPWMNDSSSAFVFYFFHFHPPTLIQIRRNGLLTWSELIFLSSVFNQALFENEEKTIILTFKRKP